MPGGANHNLGERCAPTTPPEFVDDPAMLPHFAHIVATWVSDCGLGPLQNLARDAALFREVPEARLEQA